MRVQSVGFIEGEGLGVEGSGFKGLGVKGSGFRVQGFGIQGFGFRGSGFEGLGFSGFRGSGFNNLWFRVERFRSDFSFQEDMGSRRIQVSGFVKNPRLSAVFRVLTGL